MSTLPDKPLLRPAEVADFLGISVRHVNCLVDRGDLVAVQVSERVRRITKASVENLLQRGTSAA